MLTTTEITLIKDTAPVLATHGVDITSHFYDLLFANNPQLTNIFNMNNQQGGEQQQALARAVYAFAAHVDNLDAILGEVERIAQKHASLGITAEHYPLVGSALLQAIQEVLNPPVDVLDAWAKGYGILANVLIEREAQIYQQNADQNGGWRATRAFTVVAKERESELVTSFYLSPQDGETCATFLPGQYISVYLTPAGSEQQQIRQYSLSDSHKPNQYRISVKREARDSQQLSVSNYLHDQVEVGDKLNISAPCGDFHLKDSAKPAVLVSGGVGITPMQSMLETLIARDPERDVHFVHGTENGGHHSFSHRLQQLSREGKVIPHIFYANASEADRAEQRFQYEGQTDLTAIEAELPIDDAEFYLCGPLAMMKAMYLQLKMLKVPDNNIFYEVFGPTKSLAD